MGLFRLGVVSDIAATACYLAVVALLYDLLKAGPPHAFGRGGRVRCGRAAPYPG